MAASTALRIIAIAACGIGLAATSHSQTRSGSTIVYANTSGPGTLDPPMSLSTFEIETEHQLFEGLVVLDENYQPRPMLAAKVDVNADATMFTFALRKGVKFHNDKEMTAADVLATFQRYARVSPNAGMLADVAGYDTPDPYTFVIRLKKTNAVFLNMLQTPGYPLDILPAEQADKAAREAELIGTGPFRLGEWVRDSHLVMRRFDGYVPDTSAAGPDGYAGRKTVQVEAVRYNFIPEASTRVAAVKAGEADIAGVIPPDMAKNFGGFANLDVKTVFPGCMSLAFLHTQNPPTDNILIRQAITAAIDTDDVIAGAGQIAKLNASLLYADSPYFVGQDVARFYNQKNPAKARELLRQAGYKGEKIILQTNGTYAPMRDSTLIMAEALKAAGINAEVQVLDVVNNFQSLQRATKNWNVNLSWFCSQPLLGPQQWKPFLYNFSAVKEDKVMDDGFADFFGKTKFEDRKAAWAAIEGTVFEKAYIMKMSDFAWLYAYNTRLKGLQPWYTLRFWNVGVQ